MNKLARKTVNAKNAVVRNKNAIKLAAVTIPVIVVQARAIKQHNDFLRAHGLLDEYFAQAIEAV